MIKCKEIDDYIDYMHQHPEWINRERWQLIDNILMPVLQRDDVYIDDRYSKCIKYIESNYPYRLFPYQKFLIACMFLYRSSDRSPVYTSIVMVMGRGNGKDGLISPVAHFLTTPLNGIKGYNVDICASSEKQAKDTFAVTHDMLDGNPKFRGKVRVTMEEIEDLKTHSIMRYNTSTGKTKDGKKTGCTIMNEIHAYPDWSQIKVYRSARGKIPETREIIISTAGDVRSGPYDEILDTCRDILKTGDNRLDYFPFICCLDSKSEAGDMEAMHQANPSMEYMPELQRYIAKDWIEAQTHPEMMSEYLAKRCNIPVQQTLSPVAAWDDILASSDPVPDLTGQPCIIGIDYAKVSDMVSCCLVFRRDGRIYVRHHSWYCTQSCDKDRIKAPLQEWAEMGILTMVDDIEIDPHLITDWLRQQPYAPRIVCMDSYRWAIMRQALEEYGIDGASRDSLRMIRPQDRQWIAPRIDSWFRRHTIAWGDDPMMRWYTNNTMTVPAKDGKWDYGKIEPHSRKTDGFFALLHALVVLDDVLPETDIVMDSIDLSVISF